MDTIECAKRLAAYDLVDWQGPTGDCADMRAAITVARAYQWALKEIERLRATLDPERLKGIIIEASVESVSKTLEHLAKVVEQECPDVVSKEQVAEFLRVAASATKGE